MQNWKLSLSYDGTCFHGWQIQPGLATIQGTLAEAIRHVVGEAVLPQGSGRTDAGVHALGQVASFGLECSIPPANLLRALNRSLPSSIRIQRAEHVSEEFHARHSARRKTYEYRIFPGLNQKGEEGNICSPFLSPYVWDCPMRLDIRRMHEAAQLVTGTHDFTSFMATEPDRSHREGDEPAPIPVRTIYRSCWQERDGLLVYRVTGSGFLHHMVRNLTGTFVEVGSGRRSPESIPEILTARDRSAAGQTAPARGLFLVEVEY